MAETTNISKLIINYLTEEQYTTAKASGLINENELYVTDVQDSTTLDCFEELFTATEGQTLFTLTEGTYQIGESRLTVCVNGAQQPSTAYTETSSSSFTFDSGLSVGDSVIARYFNSRITSNIVVQAHKSSHASAGSDALTPSDIGAATSTHIHGNITNGGAVGSTPNLPLFTGDSGLLETKSIADTKTLLGIVAGAQIATGSYTGTGTYGSSNPTTLTFGFAPKLMMIWKEVSNEFLTINGDGLYMAPISGLSTTYKNVFNPSLNSAGTIAQILMKVSSDGKAVYWYSSSDAINQQNVLNNHYYYYAIG